MTKLNFFYHINLENNSAGGVLNFLRGLCNSLCQDYELIYTSLNYGSEIKINKNIKKNYIGNCNLNPNKKKIVPHNVKYIIKCLFMKKKYNEDDILIFNRVDHIIPFIFIKSKKMLIIHGSSEFDKLAYSKWSVKKIYLSITEKLAMKFMNKIVLVSQDALSYYKKKYPAYKNKFIYIPTFFDSNIFNREQKKTISNKLTYIYTGRFEKEKGMEELIGYIQFLNINSVEFEMFIIGEGSYKSRLEKLDNVIIVDSCSQNKLVNYLDKSHIFLLFSKFEGTPLSLIEAQAMGIPCITSCGGELKNLISNDYNGYKYAVVNDSFKEIIENSLYILENYSKFQQNCFEFSKDFEIQLICDKYKNIFIEFSKDNILC